MKRGVQSPLLYFGKVPSRGDFVRSVHAPMLTHALDRWLSGGMDLLAVDARWKLLYDRTPQTLFALLGSRQSRGIAGLVSASQDASGRRFPFVAAGTFECEDPLHFMARAPLALTRPWAQLMRSVQPLAVAEDGSTALAALAGATLPIEADGAAYDAIFDDFCEMQTIGLLHALLADAGHCLDLRQLIIGLGLLLQPVLSSGLSRLDQGLLLPLPRDPLSRPMMGSFWLELVSPFLARASFEVALFEQPAMPNQAPCLMMGFEGSSARSLHALIDPDQVPFLYIDTRKSEWVEASITDDYAIHKLSSYLYQDGLSLRQAVATFREVFLGV